VTAVAERAATRAPILITLAQNIRGVRQAFGWSMKAASERSGVPPGTIKSIEALRGNPGVTTLFRLANGFGLTFTDLLNPRFQEHLPPEPLSVVRYPDPEALSFDLGPKIATFRRRRQLGRVKFAALCGMSKSMLLYIEQKRMEPSLTLLERIAVGLGIPLPQLVEGQDSPVVASGARSDVLRLLQAHGYAELARDRDTGGVHLALTELALGKRQRVAFPPLDAGARAVIYVLEGIARVIGPAGEHNLAARETIILTADVALTIANRGDEPAHVLHMAAAPPRWNEGEPEAEVQPATDAHLPEISAHVNEDVSVFESDYLE